MDTSDDDESTTSTEEPEEECTCFLCWIFSCGILKNGFHTYK
uniref:Uncharacterized protein n=1 Tax=viral metagenome TaxID=1070528 RepID=A0A6C0JYL5_9ZZZZ